MVRLIRLHWRIENTLYWVLDVTFGEDERRNRKDAAPENLVALRRIALNLARLEPSKGSRRGKLKRAGLAPEFLIKLINAAANI